MRSLLLVLLLLSATAHAQRLPAWLQSAAAEDNHVAHLSGDALVLLHEDTLEVAANGTTETLHRFALRIRHTDGRKFATMDIPYVGSPRNIRSARIWILRAGGNMQTFNQRDATDFVRSSYGSIYSEARTFRFDASTHVRTNDVFAFEVRVRSDSIFTDTGFAFQRYFEVPVRTARFVLTLPDGWPVDVRAINRATPQFEQTGTTRSWEKRNLPGFDPKQAFLPDRARLTPALLVRFQPSEAARARSPFRPLPNWNATALYTAETSDGAARPDAAIRTKAAQLCAGLHTDEEKIHAIGRYMQGVNYVSIALDLSVGGGFTPTPAPRVLENHYGDCKDKTALMRALLTAVGIDSRAVLARIGGGEVDPEWAGPAQFDHQIVGIRVGPEFEAPALIHHPALGPLLLFDPTDEYTRPGDLSLALHGTLVLIGDPAVDAPSRAPQFPSRYAREVLAEITAAGHLGVRLGIKAEGQSAVRLARMQRNRSPSEFRTHLQNQIDNSFGVPELGEVEWTDTLNENGQFNLTAGYLIRNHGQPIGHHLLIFQPTLFGRHTWVPPETPRTLPIQMGARAFDETTTFHLPAGFSVDETAADISLREDFGSYSARFERHEGTLRLIRQLDLRESFLEVEAYSAVSRFFRAIVEHEQTPVVLVRNP